MTTPQGMAQICAKDKQKHFDIRIKASSQFLDARFVSWVFYLGKVLWHFVSEAGANFPGRKKKKLAVDLELGTT